MLYNKENMVNYSFTDFDFWSLSVKCQSELHLYTIVNLDHFFVVFALEAFNSSVVFLF